MSSTTNLLGVGALTANGTRGFFTPRITEGSSGRVTEDGNSRVTSDITPFLELSAEASLAGAGTAAFSGLRGVIGAASLAGAGAKASAASAQRFALSFLGGVSAVSAQSVLGLQAEVSLGATGSAIFATVSETTAFASLISGGALAASGTLGMFAAVSLSAEGSLSAPASLDVGPGPPTGLFARAPNLQWVPAIPLTAVQATRVLESGQSRVLEDASLRISDSEVRWRPVTAAFTFQNGQWRQFYEEET